MKGARKIFTVFIASNALLIAKAASGDVMVPPQPSLASVVAADPLRFVLSPPGILFSVLFVSVFAGFILFWRARKRGLLKSVSLAFVYTVMSVFTAGFVLYATGDIDSPFKEVRSLSGSRLHFAAGRTSDTLYALKTSVGKSLAEGRELRAGTFSTKSRFVSNDILPYADFRYLDENRAVVIATVPRMRKIRSPDALPRSLYVGLYDHNLPVKDGFFTGALRKAFGMPRNEAGGVLSLNADRHGSLFKNIKGELYDGGDTILIKVF